MFYSYRSYNNISNPYFFKEEEEFSPSYTVVITSALKESVSA